MALLQAETRSLAGGSVGTPWPDSGNDEGPGWGPRAVNVYMGCEWGHTRGGWAPDRDSARTRRRAGVPVCPTPCLPRRHGQAVACRAAEGRRTPTPSRRPARRRVPPPPQGCPPSCGVGHRAPSVADGAHPSNPLGMRIRRAGPGSAQASVERTTDLGRTQGQGVAPVARDPSARRTGPRRGGGSARKSRGASDVSS
jgi:hypothetical protein